MHLLRLNLISATVAVLGAVSAGAQDTTPAVHISGLYGNSAVPPGIAVMPINGPNGDSIQTIIQRDLDEGGRFNVVPLENPDPKTYRDTGGTGGVNYPLFASLKVKAVVQITEIATGLHVVLHDVDSARVSIPKDFQIASPPLSRDWRFSIHTISDAIEEWITGKRGIAATRIVYRNGSTIHVIDADGAGDVLVPTDPNVFGATWHPSGKSIVYNTMGPTSRIEGLDLATGRSHTLVSPILNTTMQEAVYAPGGSTLIYWVSGDNGTNLWSTSESGSGAHQIASGLGSLNVSSSFSPDGRRIAFTSGRTGYVQVYIMDADGTNPEEITSGLKLDQVTYNSDPAWSPDGLQIVLQSRTPGALQPFQLVAINMRDRSAKYLTNIGSNQQPSWAPDGRHLVFTSDRGGSEQLWVLDVQTSVSRQLTHGAGAKLAAWSPQIQP